MISQKYLQQVLLIAFICLGVGENEGVFALDISNWNGQENDWYFWSNGGTTPNIQNGILQVMREENGASSGAWYQTKVRLDGDWTVEYEMLLQPATGICSSSGDALSFVIQNQGAQAVAQYTSGGAGYHELTYSIGFAFNYFSSRFQIDSCGVNPNVRGGCNRLQVNWTPTFNQVVSARMTYDSQTKDVYIYYNGNILAFTSLSILDDIIGTFNNEAWIGFTSGTGGACSGCQIHSFSFQSGSTGTTETVSPATTEVEASGTTESEVGTTSDIPATTEVNTITTDVEITTEMGESTATTIVETTGMDTSTTGIDENISTGIDEGTTDLVATSESESSSGSTEILTTSPEIPTQTTEGSGLMTSSNTDGADSDGAEQNRGNNATEDDNSTVVIAASVSTIVIVIALCSLFGFFFLMRRRKSQKGGENMELSGKDALPEIRNVEIVKLLGEGNFGEVYYGEWLKTPVALKKLKRKEDSEEFFKECQFLMKLQHPYLVQFLGIYTDNEGVKHLVTEYMNQGNLQDYLRRNRETLSITELTSLAKNAALSLIFLEKANIVHRDIAARNFLVHKEGNGECSVKISDFGMSRKLYGNIYQKAEAAIPVRWSAPELLKDHEYSIKTDIWAFGVVIWEIFSIGKVPFGWLSNKEVYDELLKGSSLNQPPNCPNIIFEVIRKCCDHDPNNRPTFQKIYTELCNIEEKLKSSEETLATTVGEGEIFSTNGYLLASDIKKVND